jgi:multiphosphoryl transfer protein
MVGLVLVSHSKKLAEAVRELVLQMTAPGFPIAVASGVGDTHDELGTDAVHISEVLQSLPCPEGVLVLMDLGSAVLSAETALELFEAGAVPVKLCPAPFVEGAVAAAVRAQAGGTLDEVAQEAELGLAPKQQQLQPESVAALSPATAQSVTQTPGESVECVLDVENPHGLHARPAAALVQAASRFQSDVQVSNITSGKGPVSARSLTGISLLQVRKGDRIKVVCSGSDCQQTVKAIRDLAADGFGEKLDAAVAPPKAAPQPATGAHGLPGSDGIAIGPLLLLEAADIDFDDRPAGDPPAELQTLQAAIAAVQEEIQSARKAGGANEILEAQALILADPVVLTELATKLQTGRVSAARAWSDVAAGLASQYGDMDDPYLRERAADIRDIARRVLRRIQGADASQPIRPEVPSVLFTDELLPSEASSCDPVTVLGVITSKGSATSHSAILLRTLGVPMVVGATGISEADAGKFVALNGSTGEFWIQPNTATIDKLKALQQAQLSKRNQAEQARTQPSITLDGTRIEVLANVGKAQDSQTAAENGAEGIGLLRTEFLFVSRKQAPSEDEQVQALREIYAPIAGPITVRTLDVGADKPLAFLPQTAEHNPYLGLRGIRLSLQSPQMFHTHLRAILRSGIGHDLWLMFPMISTRAEVQETLHLLNDAHEELKAQGTPHLWPVKRGIMIEVPSAALLAEQLAQDLDFFSIGTNDLTQYTMAAERGNANVAALQDALYPAVLRLMKLVAEGAAKHNAHVSICGDAASDRLTAAAFAGLGIHSLSVRPKQAAEIKALFRPLEAARLQELAATALQLESAAEVRTLIGEYLKANEPAS